MQAHRVVPRRVDPHRSPDTGASRPSRRSTYLETISAPGSMDPSAFYVDLSDYERIRRLGKGAFGVVYSAREKRTQLIVAVKERDCDVQDETMKKLFEREVQILGSVRHPALLSLHGCTPFVEHPDHMPAILTPFMANGSLEDIMKKERSGNAPAEWTMTRKLIVLLGIASGMMFMHENRYIHRDLKPGNVLIDEHFEPKIGDFGLSKFVPSGQTLYQSMHDGTPHFMAPEI
jgi:serine/threonine protein kinase